MSRSGSFALLTLAGLAIVFSWMVQRGDAPAPLGDAVANGLADEATTAARASDAGVSRRDAPTVLPRAAAVLGPADAAAARQLLLTRAATEAALALVTAEVLAVGEVEHDARGGLPHQRLLLRLLSAPDDGVLWRYRELEAPLCPAASDATYGCSTPFGDVEVGQVRTFVLGHGHPHRPLAWLLGPVLRWVVLAGPVVTAPPDPVLARVPRELATFLGWQQCNVFRARVTGVRSVRPGRPMGSVTNEIGQLDVDVLDVARQIRGLRLPQRLRIMPQPFVPADAFTSFTVGAEYWLVTDDHGLWQVLRASAPAH